MGCGAISDLFFWGSGAWGNSKTFDLWSVSVRGVRGGLGGLGGWGRYLFSVHLNLVSCPSSCDSKSGGSNHGGSSPQGCINKKVFGDPKFRFFSFNHNAVQ